MTTITITHNHAEGTLLDGTARGDGTAEGLRPRRWRRSRTLDAWHLPHSEERWLHRQLGQCSTTAGRSHLKADLAEITDQSRYWRETRRQQIADGGATDYDHSMIGPGDRVKVSGSWWMVRRANPDHGDSGVGRLLDPRAVQFDHGPHPGCL